MHGSAGRRGSLGAAGGWSLVESLAVVAIIATAAAVARPSLQADDGIQAHQAASELAGAFDFARRETQRTGLRHGVSWNTGAGELRVFRLDDAASPPAWVYDVRDPASRQPFVVRLAQDVGRDVTLDGVAVTFSGSCSMPSGFVFDLTGQPVCSNPAASRVTSAQFTVSVRSVSRQVSVAPITGRVIRP